MASLSRCPALHIGPLFKIKKSIFFYYDIYGFAINRNYNKIQHFFQYVYLGFRVWFGRVEPRQRKVKAIVNFPQATLVVDRNSEICLFTLARSQLTLRWRLRGWRPLTEIIQTARYRRRKHRRWRPGDDQDRSKFRNYENLYLRDQAKPLENHLFAVRSPLLRWHCALFFPTITRNGFCSHLQKIILDLDSSPKNQDIHIKKKLYIAPPMKPAPEADDVFSGACWHQSMMSTD